MVFPGTKRSSILRWKSLSYLSPLMFKLRRKLSLLTFSHLSKYLQKLMLKLHWILESMLLSILKSLSGRYRYVNCGSMRRFLVTDPLTMSVLESPVPRTDQSVLSIQVFKDWVLKKAADSAIIALESNSPPNLMEDFFFPFSLMKTEMIGLSIAPSLMRS